MPKTLSIFTLWSIQTSKHIIAPPSLPHPKTTVHHPSAVQHSSWLNPDGARSKSIPCCLHLHCHDSCSVHIILPWTPQSSVVGAFSIWGLRCRCFLDQSCPCCCCVCYTYILWFEPVRAFALWIPVEMYRGLTSTTSGNFCYKIKRDRAGTVNF